MSEQSKTTRRKFEVKSNNSVDVLCLRARQAFDFVAHFGLRIVESIPADGKPYVFRMTVEGAAAQVRGFEEAMLVGFIPRSAASAPRSIVGALDLAGEERLFGLG